MKKIIFALLLTTLAGASFAQSEHPETVRLHLLCQGDPLSFLNFRLKTHLNPDKPIKLEPQTYVMLEFNDAQLGIIQDINYAEQMMYLNFERGQDYYFQLNPNQKPIVSELNENTFKLELLLGKVDFYPLAYKLLAEPALNN
ncbi:MAG TPA: hypothetical protein PKC76_15975 [Saprospiraceae bacterium]|nr:hypothetical protein [Saprospiraceae bacterium]HMP25630.1 hypothetical protein [Saprospiraceae bacterium]